MRDRVVAGIKGLLVVLGWWMLNGLAQAQTVPDAGALRQQIERDQAQPLPGRAKPMDAAAPAALNLPPGMQITVRAFRFEGATLLRQADLLASAQPFLNRPIGFAELQQVSQAVAQRFRDAGWIVSTYLPAQDVTDGEVAIRVVEATFTGARVEGQSTARVPASRVLKHVLARQKPGSPINANLIDEGLLLADDLPGVAVAGALEPGAREGETGLVLRLTSEPLATGQVNVDNSGSRATGVARLTAQVQVNSPLMLGDQLRVQAAISEGSRYGRLSYDLPVGVRGTRVGGSVSALNYRVIGQDLSALGSRGWSTSLGLDLTHPLMRTRQKNLVLSSTYEFKRYANEAGGARQSAYANSSFTVAASGNMFDDLGGGGASTLGLALNSGRIRLGEPDLGEQPSQAGDYTKLQYSASRRQSVSPRLTVVAQLRGQVADSALDSSEKFYLGGPEGVRAYPASEGSGSSGRIASVDLRWQAGPQWSAAVFADLGRAENPGGLNTTLKGVGVAAAWTGPKAVTARITVAQRVGRNPNPTATGRDQDGSLVRTRVWTQLSLPF